MRPSRLAAVAVAGVALASAATASADSIAYVKGGDVWLATPDGSRQVQVTRTGGYAYVSQADDGTMIALAPGERLHRLARDGRVLADFPTYVSDGLPESGPVNRFHGPFAPEISPDGSLVAFEWFNDSYANTPGCSASSVPPCYVYSSRQGVGITRSDRLTGPEEFGLLTGWITPQWIGPDTLLRSSANTALNDDTVINKVGPGLGDDQLDHWFFDESAHGTVEQVELARDRSLAAGITGDTNQILRVYRPLMPIEGAPDWNHSFFATGNQPVVEGCFDLSAPGGGRFEDPSIAPDGRHLAVGVAEGILIADLPDLRAGCAPAGAAEVRIPGGRHPDWGPADVPAATTQTAGPGGGAAATTGGAVRARVARASLRRGLTVRVAVPGPGRLAATVHAKGTRIARIAPRTVKGTSAALSLRFTPAVRRALAKAHTRRVTVRVTFTAPGAAPQRTTVSARVR